MQTWVAELIRVAGSASGVALITVAWNALRERRSARRNDRQEAMHLAQLLYQWIGHATILQQIAIEAGAEFIPDPPPSPNAPPDKPPS